jgi:UDP-N-acetylglucosamine 2-epimerase
MIQYAVIRSGAGKDVAIVAHDTNSQRVVFKGDTDSDLYKAFSVAYERAVVIPVEKGTAILRRKVIPSQEEYLRALTSKFVHHPYEVRAIQTAEEAHRLDSLADKMSRELLEAD